MGLRPTYVAAQLTRCKVGDRHATEPDCQRIATRLTETDIAAVSAWLAGQQPPKDPSPESSDLERMPLAAAAEAVICADRPQECSSRLACSSSPAS